DEEIGIHIAAAVDGIDENLKESREKNDEYLRPHADSNPDDDQRNHGNAGRRVKRVQKRIGDEPRSAVPANEDTHDNAGDERNPESDRKIFSAECQIGKQGALSQRVPEWFG